MDHEKEGHRAHREKMKSSYIKNCIKAFLSTLNISLCLVVALSLCPLWLSCF